MPTCRRSENWAIRRSSARRGTPIFAPAGTPKPVVDKLQRRAEKITTSASFVEAMRKIGNEAKSSTAGRTEPADTAAEQGVERTDQAVLDQA
jgi:tripartite-type tricarboxylate transporter receptor subunit TctC